MRNLPSRKLPNLADNHMESSIPWHSGCHGFDRTEWHELLGKVAEVVHEAGKKSQLPLHRNDRLVDLKNPEILVRMRSLAKLKVYYLPSS